jgi:hypothetical protein
MTKNQVAIALTANDKATVHLFEIGNSYDMISNAVNGWIECVRLNHEIDMWVNEEGKMIDSCEYNPTASAIFWTNFGFMTDMIYGDVMFTSSNEDGDTIGLNIEQIEYLKEIAFDVIGLRDFDLVVS